MGDSEVRKPGRGRSDDESRRTRVPLGTKRTRLYAKERPGYVRRWVNDEAGRLSRAVDGGYEFVTDPNMRSDESGKVCTQAGTDSTGAPMKVYLMEIRREWYEEDQAEKQARVDEIDRAILGGVREDAPGLSPDDRRHFVQGSSMRNNTRLKG